MQPHKKWPPPVGADEGPGNLSGSQPEPTPNHSEIQDTVLVGTVAADIIAALRLQRFTEGAT